MAERRPHICHLTLLNPALHSRIFYKEALSMAEAGFQVTVVGQHEAQLPFDLQGVRIFPLPVFAPRSIARLRARKLVWHHALEASADVYVLHTPELLGMARRLKQRFPSARFVYDMHEDYALNIREGGYYPSWLQGGLSKRVRRAELGFAEWGHAVVFAESCFEGSLRMKQGVAFSLPNLFQPPASELPDLPPWEDALPMMLFCGTVAENWGILRALELWVKLNKRMPLRMVVAGIVYDQGLKAKILKVVADSGLADKFVWWRNGEYVPHPEVLAWIQRCDFGAAPYILRTNLQDRIPTRFYEFMAFGKPLVFTSNPPWNDLNARLAFGEPIPWPLGEASLDVIEHWLAEKKRTQIPTEAWNWSSNEELPKYLEWLRG